MAAVKMGTGRAWTVVEADEAAVLETVALLVEAGVDVNAVGQGVRLRRRPGATRSPEADLTALDGAMALGVWLSRRLSRRGGRLVSMMWAPACRDGVVRTPY